MPCDWCGASSYIINETTPFEKWLGTRMERGGVQDVVDELLARNEERESYP